jgi:hypothetical protein
MDGAAAQTPSVWTNLRDEIIGSLLERDHAKRVLAAIKSLPEPAKLREYLADLDREGAALSDEDRRRILDAYFFSAYDEVSE